MGVPAQRRAVRVAAVGAAGVRRRPRGATRCGDLPPGEPRASRQGGHGPGRGRAPRHAGGDRLPHDDGERARRARVGRGWDRGRGRDARPADVPADAARRRRSGPWRAPARDDGDRPGPDAHPDAPRARGGRTVRRVLRRRLLDARARGPRDALEHVPRVRGHVRVLAGRRRDAALPPAHRSGRPGRSRRALHEGTGPVPSRRRPRTDLHRDRRARPRRDRTLGRRTEAAAGPRPALARVGFVRRGVPRPARARPRRDRGRPAPRGGRERRRSASIPRRPSSRVRRSRYRSTTAPSVTARS